jgi:hypothetical protein
LVTPTVQGGIHWAYSKNVTAEITLMDTGVTRRQLGVVELFSNSHNRSGRKFLTIWDLELKIWTS